MFGSANIAVVGAFRSGTNYVQYLLEQNYRCRSRRGFHGWKHAPIQIRGRAAQRWLDGRVPIVAVYKHPLEFLPSLFRYRVAIDRNITAPREWDAFLRERFAIHNGRRGRTPELSFPTPVEYWNTLYLNLLDLPEPAFRCCFVSYAAVQADPEAELERLAASLGLKRRSAAFALPEGKLSRGRSGWRPGWLSDKASIEAPASNADRAPDTGRPPEFTPEQRNFVMQRVAQRLIENFGLKPREVAA